MLFGSRTSHSHGIGRGHDGNKEFGFLLVNPPGCAPFDLHVGSGLGISRMLLMRRYRYDPMGLADQVCQICLRFSSFLILLTTEASPSAWTVDAAPMTAWDYRSQTRWLSRMYHHSSPATTSTSGWSQYGLASFYIKAETAGFTECMDRRCCAYAGMGLSKPDNLALTNVSPFKPGDKLHKWMESIWTCILLHQGGDGDCQLKW